ncbi:MAG: hypothetical protein K0S39_4703 [Paenibacillus sp.]|nr:hypothetical protein [Paenibacillus sp.]
MICSAATGDYHTVATFQALVDAVIPEMLTCSGTLAVHPVPGAVNLFIHEYLIRDLDLSHTPQSAVESSLSKSTAHLLDRGADQLIQTGQAVHPLNAGAFPGGGLFAALSRYDRLRAITLLDRLQTDLQTLPLPYQNNPGLIRVMMNSVNQLTLFGYYCEWYGYGTTRLCPPDYRRLECYPPSWGLVGYPGPAFGYRDFRGFVIRFPNREEVR